MDSRGRKCAIFNHLNAFVPTYGTEHRVFSNQVKESNGDEEADRMKGFHTSTGYMGLVEGRYILFTSESDYYEYMND